MTEIFPMFLIAAIFMLPLLVGLWIFGLRRFIRKKGRTTITAANWGLSMWADWTVSWEIGREEGKVPFSAKAFLALHILVIIGIVAAYIKEKGSVRYFNIFLAPFISPR